MTKKLVAVTVSLLTACSTAPTTEPVFYSKTKTIQWRRVANVDEHCRNLHPDLRSTAQYQGCAKWYRAENKCVIVTGLHDNFEIIGHELKHCFVGEFHK